VSHRHPVEVNDRSYAFPQQPTVVVCVDGSEPDYHELAMKSGRMPFLSRLAASGDGSFLSGECTVPSFTNPNNISIATGVPPSIHGICGNSYLDPASDEEVMMNDPGLLRAPSIFAAFETAGARVAVVTAKDKLRRLLGHGLEKSICVSAEKADQATATDNGIDNLLEFVGRPLPDVYSAELSEFVMAAGVRILREHRPDLMYLTLTDFVQHKYAPGTPEADDFYAMLDRYLAELHELGAVVVVTADHGMNAKSTTDGRPRVVYLEETLDEALGQGRSRVVLPIADPYTRHHGSLGSFALVYLDGRTDGDARAVMAATPGVAEVMDRVEACDRFELPADRIGDLVIVGDRHVALGRSPADHDLSELDRPLRSHGGLTEQRVPVIANRRLRDLPDGHRLRNFDAYWVALNFVGGSTAGDLVVPAEEPRT
jgi:phosphonoacetate hydrolase